jgi:ribonucleotide reductase beta subunit family protein with ferritin-like domain
MTWNIFPTCLQTNYISFPWFSASFFAISDKIVADNLSQNFMTEVISLEVQFFFGFQATHDGKHQQWNLLIDIYIKDKKKQN